MTGIDTQVQTIRTSRYGREMRNAIAKAFEILASGDVDFHFEALSESEYAALTTKDPNTVYMTYADPVTTTSSEEES